MEPIARETPDGRVHDVIASLFEMLVGNFGRHLRLYSGLAVNRTNRPVVFTENFAAALLRRMQIVLNTGLDRSILGGFTQKFYVFQGRCRGMITDRGVICAVWSGSCSVDGCVQRSCRAYNTASQTM